MPKKVYCAQCGEELLFILKAIPTKGLIITMVEPHTCKEETEEFPYKDEKGAIIPKDKEEKSDVATLFDSFEFVQKSNKLNKRLTIPQETGDKRSDQVDLNSSAPSNILDVVRSGQTDLRTPPAHDEGEEPNEEK